MKIFKTGLYLLALTMLINACKTTSALTFDNDNIEKSMVAALKWQEANPIQVDKPVDWTHGAYYTGVAKAHESTSNPVFLQAIKDKGTINNWQTWKRFFHADDIVISYSYLYLNEQEPNVIDMKPTTKFIDDHFNKPHAWKEGTDPKGVKTILWWWCDALFMAPPVIAKYAKLTGESELLETSYKYFKETYDLLYDKEEHLFARDTRFVWDGDSEDMKEENGKKIFWSRGNGWVIGGLALLLDELPKDAPHRAFYEELYLTMAAKIKEIQPKDGLWRTSLLSPESWDHGEVSGSGFYTFALTWGINNGMLDRKEYEPVVKKAWAALMECQHPNGKVGWVQNIGAAPDPASKDSWQNFGTGAFLLAGSEIRKLK